MHFALAYSKASPKHAAAQRVEDLLLAMMLALPWVALTTQYCRPRRPHHRSHSDLACGRDAASGAMLLAPVPMAAITYVTTL